MSNQGGNNRINITNKRATILNSVYIDKGAAKILVDISKTQDLVVGNGTTTVAVLAGELLREAENLKSIFKLLLVDKEKLDIVLKKFF